MNDNPVPYSQNDPLVNENSFVSTAEAEEEKARKELSYKRMTILFLVLSLIVAALIIWEVADLLAGGRP